MALFTSFKVQFLWARFFGLYILYQQKIEGNLSLTFCLMLSTTGLFSWHPLLMAIAVSTIFIVSYLILFVRFSMTHSCHMLCCFALP